MAFQAGPVTTLLAGIVLETTGAPLLQGPLLHASFKAAPSNLWTATDFRPHLSHLLYAVVLVEVLVTAASQFSSTIFLSGFENGTSSQRSNSTNVDIPNDTDSAGDAWWSMPPVASWTFAELPGSFENRSGFQDTGHDFRAFLPSIPPADILGPGPTPFFIAIIVSLPTMFISTLNFTFDPGVILFRRNAGAISGNAYPTHINLF